MERKKTAREIFLDKVTDCTNANQIFEAMDAYAEQFKPVFQEKIVCAAIKRKYRRICHNPYHEGENDILNIEIGYRHCDILIRFEGEVSKNPIDQGFYTSTGRFVDRQEAYKIAFDNDQIWGPNKGCPENAIGLTSEDLY